MTHWAMTTWANKGGSNVTWEKITAPINGRYIDAYGRLSGMADYNSGIPRRTLCSANGTPAYAMYDDDSKGNVPVIRITED